VELRHLRYFVAVARERSFSRAAQVLHMAQPPLSRQVQQLEEELGVVLLERGTRPTRLTEHGRLIYEQAVQVLERADEIQSVARRMRLTRRNLFRVGFVGSTLYGKLPEVIRAYRAARPAAEVAMVELTSMEQVIALKEGRIDIGFGRVIIDEPGIHRMLLRNEVLVAALPNSHPLTACEAPLRLEDLTGEALIVYPKAPRPSFADQVLALFRDRGLRLPVVHEVRELQTALGLVAAEAGLCLVPSSVERLRRDNVVYRPLGETGITSPIFAVFREGDPSPEIEAIIDLVRDLYRSQGIAFGT